jgi:hypothetical protein
MRGFYFLFLARKLWVDRRMFWRGLRMMGSASGVRRDRVSGLGWNGRDFWESFGALGEVSTRQMSERLDPTTRGVGLNSTWRPQCRGLLPFGGFSCFRAGS